MPKLGCPCGYVHNLSPIPDEGWHTLADREYNALVPSEAVKSIDLWYNLLDNAGALYECPQCGRLMWEKPGAEKFVVYRRDE